MNCSICDKEIEKELVFTISDSLTLAYFSVILKSRHFPTCADCFSKWTHLLEILFQDFKEKKMIDEEIIKRILNENI